MDYQQKSVTFADKVLDLQPEAEAVTSDIENVIQYMQGTHDFTGDTAELRATYWKIMIYMFSAPFIAPLRYSYREIAPANSVGRPFPMYMVLRGPKNGCVVSLWPSCRLVWYRRKLFLNIWYR